MPEVSSGKGASPFDARASSPQLWAHPEEVEREASARRDLFGVAIVAALIALAVAFGAQRGRRTLAVVARTVDVTALSGDAASYTLFPTSGRLEVVSRDGRSRL